MLICKPNILVSSQHEICNIVEFENLALNCDIMREKKMCNFLLMFFLIFFFFPASSSGRNPAFTSVD